MKEMVKKYIDKYWDVIPYALFGVLTTIVNLDTYWIMTRLMHQRVMFSTAVAWLIGVLFAYVTNRKWVFKSCKRGLFLILQEMICFFSCRLLTGMIDWGIMFVFADVLNIADFYVKCIANVVVILFNYTFSKKIIFKRGN